MTDKNEQNAIGTVSFNFKRKITSKVDEAKVVKEKEEANEEYLNEIDQKVLNKKPRKEPKLIIPLINKNKWNYPSNPEEQDVNDSELQLLAAKELMKESAEFLEKNASEDPEKELESLEVPLLLKNKVPDGFETDEKLDVELRPDEATLQNYEQIPIKAFGMAMLRGMGWDPKVGIGKTFKQNVKVLETAVRPRGLGLGASVPGAKDSNQSTLPDEQKDEHEVKKGAYVQVQGGSNKKKYGIIEGIDADNALCLVKFALGGKTASVGEFNLKVVSKSEYTKYGKDLSRLTEAHEIAEKLKRSDHSKKEKNGQSHEDGDDFSKKVKAKKRSRSPRADEISYDSRKSVEERHHKKKKHDDATYKASSDKDKHQHKHKKKKHHKDLERTSAKESRRKTWLLPNLRVRMIDEDYKKGKYYRQKFLVVDVYDRDGHCSCQTEGGMLLDDLHENMLETVVPRSSSDAYVIITTGGKSKHDGKMAKILEKDKENSTAILQLIEDRDVALEIAFDDICEYAGDVEALDHF